MSAEVLTSASNPKIKKLIALQQKSSERRESGLFVVEGRREIEHCVNAGYVVDSVFYCPELAGVSSLQSLMSEAFDEAAASLTDTPSLKGADLRGRCPRMTPAAPCSNILLLQNARTAGRSDERENAFNAAESKGMTAFRPRFFQVSKEIYEKIAYRESTEGVIAEVRTRDLKLEDLQLGRNPLIMVLESVEKPGNLGAVLRSADASGVTAVLVCDPKTDLYNPNLIRASIGAIFTVPCVACSSEDAIKFLKDNNIQILTAQLQDSSLYYDCDMKSGTAIVMGTEATGLTAIWRKAADAHIRIPMLGRLDSLNVSVSAAILLYESVRQRNNG